MPGGSSGHTSRTAQGAWSTTNRVACPRLCGPRRDRSPSRAATSRSTFSATARITSRSTRPRRWSCSASSRPSLDAAAASNCRRRLVRNVLHPAGRLPHVAAATQQAGRCDLRRRDDVGRCHVKDRDLGFSGDDPGCRVDASLPGPFDQPHDDPHGAHHPITRRESQSARVDAISTGGTVIAPRRRNSAVETSVPRCRRIRSHRSVASEPT